jgi:hypothetical protein
MRDFVRFTTVFGTIVYGLFCICLLSISLAMVGYALWGIAVAVTAGSGVIEKLLEAVGLIVISIAVFDVSKYLLEEEILRGRRLRSLRDARQTLTKFLVIIAIAVTLEALVFVFGAGRQDMRMLLYPTLLLFVATLLIVGLGVFQRLSVDTEAKERQD